MTKLTDLVLKPKPIISIEAGDFQEEVIDNVLYIRQDAYDIGQDLDIRSAAEFYSLVDSFPTTYVTGLGWSYEELEKAKEKLKEKINAKIIREHTLCQ